MTVRSTEKQTSDAAAYISDYLDGSEYGLRDFVASALNPATPMSIHIEICEECGFLHVAGTQCDICPTIRTVSGQHLPFLLVTDDRTGFFTALAEARLRRARMLQDLWMSGHLGADALFWASMSEPTKAEDWSEHAASLHLAPAPTAAAPSEKPRLLLAA